MWNCGVWSDSRNKKFAMESLSSSPVHKVVIVGAGISGLSAARHLLKSGISDLLILEASEKVGGRINTINFGDGLVELGAQWVHGEENKFCELVKASGHRHGKTSWEGKGDFLCENGEKIRKDLVDEVMGWVEAEIERVEETFSIETFQQNGKAAGGAKTSMGEYLQKRFLTYLKEEHPECEESSKEWALRMALFQWGMSFQRIDNSCNGMNDVSLYRWSEFEVNPGEHFNNFRVGAQSFVDQVLMEPSIEPLIRLNSSVRNIDWAEDRVKVTIEDGTIVWTEMVLVTCSIGVLKSISGSLFTPSLPEKLVKAIHSTGFGPVTKIFLKWEKPWWSTDLEGFQLVWPNKFIDCCKGVEGNDKELKENWYKTITGFDPVLENPNVLLAWLGGPEAVYVEESLSEDEIGKQCVQVLRNFTELEVPEVAEVVVSKWNTNKFVQGAYSFRSVDGDTVPGDICSVLCEPVMRENVNKPVIILAGEALSKAHYSTLHGAFESGMDQAEKIVQYFDNASKNSKDAKPA